MVTVYVWFPKPVIDGEFPYVHYNVGHASIDIGGDYYSWWPTDDISKAIIGSVPPALRSNKIDRSDMDRKIGIAVNKGLKQDIQAEQGGPAVIELNNLDEEKMKGWLKHAVGINKINAAKNQVSQYQLLSSNCSTLVGKALTIGIENKQFSNGFDFQYLLKPTVWTPGSVFNYAKGIETELNKK